MRVTSDRCAASKEHSDRGPTALGSAHQGSNGLDIETAIPGRIRFGRMQVGAGRKMDDRIDAIETIVPAFGIK
jgi:hypothetical protein